MNTDDEFTVVDERLFDMLAQVAMIGSAVPDSVDDPTVGGRYDLALRLAAIDDLRRQLADIRGVVESACARLMEGDVEVVPGFGTITRHWASTSKWDTDGVVRAIKASVVAKAREDVGTEDVVNAVTGEVIDVGPIVERAIDRTRAALTEKPRIKGLQALGIKPNAYRDRTGGRWVVVATPDQEAPSE